MSVVVDTFDNIVNPQSPAWSKLREGERTYKLDLAQASAADLQYYEIRGIAHQQGLTEAQFVDAVKAGRMPQFAAMRGRLELKDRRERARAARYPFVEEFVASGLAAGPSPPPHVLSHRLDACGLSTRGSQAQQWRRLREYAYQTVSPELLRFLLQRARAVPREQLLLKSKRELFAQWHGQQVEAEDVFALLDAWHHHPNYEARAQAKDVSDVALESAHFAQYQAMMGGDDEMARSVQHALRPAVLHAVTNFYGLDSSNEEDTAALLSLSRGLVTASRDQDHDDDPQPHWASVLAKVEAGDGPGAAFSAFSDDVAGLKRKLRQAQREGLLQRTASELEAALARV